MRKLDAILATVCAILLVDAASATTYRLSAMGRVANIRLHDYDTNTDSSISGLIGIGDSFNFTAMFDTSSVILSSLFDLDPSVNVYFLLGTHTEIDAGGYHSAFTPRFDTSSSAQFWNDRNVVGLTDSQSFSFDNVYYPGPYPYNLSKGALRTEQVSVYAFDWTHLVRYSDLISEIDFSSGAFSSNSISYVLSSADGGQIRQAVFLDIGSVNWTIRVVPGGVVPEPTTWGLMITGFSLIGLATRRRSITHHTPIY